MILKANALAAVTMALSIAGVQTVAPTICKELHYACKKFQGLSTGSNARNLVFSPLRSMKPVGVSCGAAGIDGIETGRTGAGGARKASGTSASGNELIFYRFRVPASSLAGD